MAVDLPGSKKEDITLPLANGIFTVSSAKGADKDESDKKDKPIRAVPLCSMFFRNPKTPRASRE
ncbi:MAG: hypothetical protein J5933_04985 [Clostridia bacterium]|nr:hypothetical protein [Clostridia bacterium]